MGIIFGFHKPEVSRRKLNVLYDTNVSNMHKLNYRIAKPYIANKKVLDIGCWTGQFESQLSKNECRLTAIDPSVEATEFAKRKKYFAVFLTGTAEKLPFKQNSFDVVLFFDVLEHLPKRIEFRSLSEIHRVLRKGGVFILSTPNNNIFSILFDPAFF